MYLCKKSPNQVGNWGEQIKKNNKYELSIKKYPNFIEELWKEKPGD